MTDTPTDRPPNADESMELAAEFLRIAELAADGDRDTAATALADYLTDDPEVGFTRLWYLASVGPILVSAGLRKLNAHLLDGDEFWGITHLDSAPKDHDDPAALAALQSVAAHLNNDQGAARDVIAAHHHAAHDRAGSGAEALADMVLHHLRMLATLITNGAFPR
ncbi:hypothetical protein B1813_18895 [Saccharomonospora piscinae]|uniref:Uncharacterized protein n=1 Tax=Saccharomonospora piscinae TaxID=687388 RepID=A0A1V8ZYB0_SACPI|nr:hypothetical protein [Saccharomonospora piscinae]OQO89909.1 hypothetical protein B1813_18895 [Saccharomonospora piscinae]